MTIEERLKLEPRVFVVFDPLEILRFVDYELWEPTINNCVKLLLKNPVKILHVATSKCQSCKINLAGERHVVIDENFLYLLNKFSAIVTQICYANLECKNEVLRKELIRHAYAQYDIMLLRYEAIHYIFADKANQFFSHHLEFLSKYEECEKYDKTILNEDRQLIGKNSEYYNNILQIIVEMQYMWVVLHELAHCYFEDYPERKKELYDDICDFSKKSIDFYKQQNTDVHDFSIYSLESVFENNNNIEEIACDYIAIDIIIKIFSEKLQSPKKAYTIYCAAWAYLDYNLSLLNVMSEMNSNLLWYGNDMDGKDKNWIKNTIQEKTKELQRKYHARTLYIGHVKSMLDREIFKEITDEDKDFDEFILDFINSGKELYEKVGLDYTSGNYLSEFFRLADKFIDSETKIGIEMLKELYSWN